MKSSNTTKALQVSTQITTGWVLPPSTLFFQLEIGFQSKVCPQCLSISLRTYSHLARIWTYLSGKACRAFPPDQIHFPSMLPHHPTGHAAAGIGETQAGARPRVITCSMVSCRPAPGFLPLLWLMAEAFFLPSQA